MPLHDLSPLSTIAASERLRVHQSTEGVSASIGSMGIHFAAGIASYDVDLSLVDETNHLNIRRRSCELDTFKRSFWDKTSALSKYGVEVSEGSRQGKDCEMTYSSRTSAPCYHLAFSIADD